MHWPLRANTSQTLEYARKNVYYAKLIISNVLKPFVVDTLSKFDKNYM